MAHDFIQLHRVEFADTDAAGLAHFTAFFRWMEVTEHAFYRSLGGNAFERTDEGEFGVPRVSVSCDFVRPVGFGDELSVHLRVVAKSPRMLEYECDFRTHPGGEDIARGSMTVVSAFRAANTEAFKATPLPDTLFQAIKIVE